MERLLQQLNFIIEIDKLKNIYRQTYVLHENRKENDSEHSWHLAMMAVILSEYSNNSIDILKVIKMVLIHDIVEIDAGDTFCYDVELNKTKAQREKQAATRLFGLLPEEQKIEFMDLWNEFELMESNEAKFAAALDRMQPLLLNIQKNGLSWAEHEVTYPQIYKRNKHIQNGSLKLWEYVKNLLDDCLKQGIIKNKISLL